MRRVADRPLLRFGRVIGAEKREAWEGVELFGVGHQEEVIFERLKRSATLGESTSLVLCGHSGCGKHATLARAVERLDACEGVPRYDVAELSGLVHAEAATGLRELTHQLAAQQGKPGAGGLTSRYVDDLALVVDELRRRRAERRAPLLVVLSDLDAFALQPRQTLLYTLLDAMQSRLGCVVVVGVTTDHGVLELFEKRVRSRLQNFHVSFPQATRYDVQRMFDDRFALDAATLRRAKRDGRVEFKGPKRAKTTAAAADGGGSGEGEADGAEAYCDAHAASWRGIRESRRFQDEVRDGVACGRSMRWFSRVAGRAAAALGRDVPVVGQAQVDAAFRAMNPNSDRSWREAVSALPPCEKALFVALLKLERVGAPYTLESAIHGLARLAQASAADAHDDAHLVDAMDALVEKSVAVLSHDARNRRDAHALRYSHVALSAAIDVDDLWLALRTDDLHCPTALRQWALNHAA